MTESANDVPKKRGRKPLTPAERQARIEERKAKYWGAKHNERRRARYAGDAEYAERQRQNRRGAYRRQVGELDTHNQSLSGLQSEAFDRLGRQTSVAFGGLGPVEGTVFEGQHVAELLGRSAPVFYRWRSEGMFPRAVLTNGSQTYYADVEVLHFVSVMTEHRVNTPYYRKDHHAIRERLEVGSFAHNTSAALQWVAMRSADGTPLRDIIDVAPTTSVTSKEADDHF